MTSRAIRSITAFALCLVAVAASAGEPSLDRAVTEAIELPATDMAVIPKSLAKSVAIRMTEGATWSFVDLATGKTEAIATIADLKKSLAARAAKLPGKGPASELTVFLAADRRLDWAAMQQAMMATAGAKVARLWIVGRRADGAVGALPAFLPLDPDVILKAKDPTKVTQTGVSVSAKRGDGEVGAGALYAWAWRTRQDAKDAPVVLQLNGRRESAAGGVVAALNEARRFGFSVTFSGGRADDAAVIRFKNADPQAVGFRFVAPKNTAEPPKLVPGKALAGDPHDGRVLVHLPKPSVVVGPR